MSFVAMGRDAWERQPRAGTEVNVAVADATES
jgi:hypothetical protein